MSEPAGRSIRARSRARPTRRPDRPGCPTARTTRPQQMLYAMFRKEAVDLLALSNAEVSRGVCVKSSGRDPERRIADERGVSHATRVRFLSDLDSPDGTGSDRPTRSLVSMGVMGTEVAEMPPRNWSKLSTNQEMRE